jgi:hypothetical protein
MEIRYMTLGCMNVRPGGGHVCEILGRVPRNMGKFVRCCRHGGAAKPGAILNSGQKESSNNWPLVCHDTRPKCFHDAWILRRCE